MAEEYDDFEKQLAENRTGLDIFNKHIAMVYEKYINFIR
jgi:hypothetical protein